MSSFAALSLFLLSSALPVDSVPEEPWNAMSGKPTIQVAHDHVINPITSGRWELSGILEIEFVGRIDPHENSTLTVMGPGLEGLRGEFEEVRFPGEWRYELSYDYSHGTLTLKNLRPNRAPAFPRAEGFGKYALGGRGGRVYEVTHLGDSGPGSLREACEAEGPRVVIFRVSGTIALESELRIEHPYITIAGQTAPGDGICVKNYQVRLDTDHLIIRYMRFRPGDEKGIEQDGFGGDGDHIIIDHCSVSWGTDETLSINKASNMTVQWCLVSESLFNSLHKKGNHGYGGLWGGPGGSFHHNVLAHHSSRNPRASGNQDSGLLDFRNNVVYNWGFNSAYGGELWPRNWVNNYYKPGPATRDGVRRRIFIQKDPRGKMFAAGNFMVGFPEVTADNWAKGIDYSPDGQAAEATLRVNQEFCAAPVATQFAEAAYASVLPGVGASRRRDAVDARIIEEIRTATARYGTSFDGGGNGIIDSQSEVGGWPKLKSEPAPADGDHDGMPDQWERDHQLDPHHSQDGPEDGDGDGYTNLDDYLNYLAAPEDYVPAFPGAEGYGRFTKGGRGGDAYCVTNLNDAGPGSLREGIETALGPRTILFAVSGTIQLESPVED